MLGHEQAVRWRCGRRRGRRGVNGDDEQQRRYRKRWSSPVSSRHAFGGSHLAALLRFGPKAEGVKIHGRLELRTRNRAQTWSMVNGQPAVGEKNAQAPSRAARQAGRGAPARRRPRNGQHLLGRRSYGRRRAHAWRRHQPRGTRARAAAAHPAARSRTPTCGGRWRCRRTPPLVRRSPPPRASVAQQPSGRCHGAASAGHVSTRRKRRRSPHAPRGTAAGAEGWVARRGEF